MPRGRKARPSQPLIEDLSPLSEARSALLSPGTTSVSPTGTQSLLPGTTPGSISTLFTTPGNTQNPFPIPSTQQSPTPNPGGQFPSQLTQETGNNFPEVEGGTGKLHWTGAMEKSALQLYVAAVQSGKQSDGGFKIDVHRSIARDLSAEFPGIPFTGEKLRSKCNQCFKKWYNAFLACKDASGFGWNEQHNMVTASEEVWEAFLRSHPAARRFKNTSFPEYHELFVIFGGHTATGALRRGANGEGENDLDVAEEQMGTNATDRFSGDDENDCSGAEGTTSGSQPAGVRPRRRHRLSSGDRFENSIERLITAFASTSEPVPEVSSRVEQAIAKFQDDFAEGLTNAMAWMRRQIEIYNSSHNV
ncbi:hypothetical protein Pst134EA_022544 [Puccinia striiformis f. sp. tritici]|uniref:Myb/SANT-like domain-containing protein n=1 Tax=Puccinia striiformis f. sp. tritici PST-78 TaxID=1165861 RepID=A0A0L0VRG3_9BASI|nr:hypothetical protein Pst134EA_022544 [Puccinia striiformis f. sp. tritici]KAH9445600.1 hypothetical protein Pst134EB_023438 [Puccinia striiformis f. sp. tritici]KAH9455068.1 hypothetical protein Pst134EA_022544 [Puccinia striiformis f. sp. tritici]KAI9611811.1 hypothetical protein KEM48_004373 [Puccinia striiformis f. sp. tritici PST-130]KNF01585.1 hypothetical protein PSTG_05363 [Puccinia striiformis f. sp. tritici PST-78]